MQPHTVHLVLTLGPTLCQGGHFYSSHSLVRTMHARCLENLHSDTLTNETLPQAWALLHRMMLYAHQKVIVEDLESPYPLDDLAALVMMCWQPNYFRNSAEKQQTHGFYVQQEKARLAAKALAHRPGPLKLLLDTLQTRALHWDGLISGHWHDKMALYLPPGKTVEEFLTHKAGREKVVDGGMTEEAREHRDGRGGR
jgi:hypothetical protein